jgi:CubicO group peptidase (beta-lactamase class C family)
MRKSRIALAVTVGPLLAAAAAVAALRLLRLGSLGAAYKAKALCSGVFISHRDPASILDSDLHFSILPLVKDRIDYQRKEVTSRFFGIIRRSARFTPGLGCSLCYPWIAPPAPPLPAGSPGEASSLPEALDPRLDAILDSAFADPDPKRLKRTRAVVILHKGKIVAERYQAGFSRNTPLLGWSMAKTVMNALVGILVREGKLSLDRPVPVPEWQEPGDPRAKITLNHLLQMSSGLVFAENYGDPLQDVTRMLYAVPDAAAYAAAKPILAEAGSTWSYSSGTTNIISRGIRLVLGDSEYADYPRRALFEPIGMNSAVIEPDASGTFVGSSFIYAAARDWAKLGQLYLQDGVWNGERILPEGWVKYSTTPAPQAPDGRYGAHIWLKIPDEFRGGAPGAPVPADAFHAVGHEGQLLSVIPSQELVVVRLGLTRDQAAWRHDLFLAAILKALA